MTIVLRKCDCGKYKSYGDWTRPDQVQQKLVAQAINSKQIEIVREVCEPCKKESCE